MVGIDCAIAGAGNELAAPTAAAAPAPATKLRR
jgi:hypothetical protein